MISSDRELLELAALAAGIDVSHARQREHGTYVFFTQWTPNWNPLKDDGDALRLATKLGLDIMPYPIYSDTKHSVIVTRKRLRTDENEPPEDGAVEVYGDDKDAATRRAIVRAAAAIGKSMTNPSGGVAERN